MSKKVKWLERLGNILHFRDDSRGSANNPFVVVLLGPAGSGRSTFINAAIKQSKRKCEKSEGSGSDNILQPITTEVDSVRYSETVYHNREFLFIDTPGLDLEETDLLSLQEKTFKLSKDVDAMIYLHRVNNPRLTTPPDNYVKIFKLLGGTGWERKAMIATTMWSKIDSEAGEVRETQLREKFWKDPMAKGAKLDRFNASHEDAWRLINQLVGSK